MYKSECNTGYDNEDIYWVFLLFSPFITGMTKYRNGRNGPQRTATGFRCGSVVAYSVAVFRHTLTKSGQVLG